jgi:hypothetical protein
MTALVLFVACWGGLIAFGFWLMWRCGWDKGKGPSL